MKKKTLWQRLFNNVLSHQELWFFASLLFLFGIAVGHWAI